MKLLRLLAVSCGFVSTMSSASAQETTIATVLARAGVYVVELQRNLAGIVAEEQYVQDVRTSLGSPRQNQLMVTHRELKSDVLVMKPLGADRWIPFRDVFEVDGKPVRDRNERLMKLNVDEKLAPVVKP